MHMSIILIPADGYAHQHVLRHGGVSGPAGEKAVRNAIASINPDVQVLHVEADVTPDFVTATVAAIKEDDPTHDPLHPADLTIRDPAKVEAEKAAAAGRAQPGARDAVAKARAIHAKIRGDAAPKPPAPVSAPVAVPAPKPA